MQNDSPSAPNSPLPEEWLKASEARYDSMRTLLQSVRHDIDALTSRIDSTRTSPGSVAYEDQNVQLNSKTQLNNYSRVLEELEDPFTEPPVSYFEGNDYSRGLHRPDLLADVSQDEVTSYTLDEDEYMNIKIRDQNLIPVHLRENRLLDCTVVDSSNTLSNQEEESEIKSWRSPSDFCLHDPFDGNTFDNEFTYHQGHSHLDVHGHQSFKETDLDDLPSDKYDPDDQSGGSLSPAISPTFEKLVTEDVNLNNMLVTSDDKGHFQFDSGDHVARPNSAEVFEVYDNGHALTTIDEASEEIEDDWSSSELDASTHSGENLKARSLLVTADNVLQAIFIGQSSQSMNKEFKTPSDLTLCPLTVNTNHNESETTKNGLKQPTEDTRTDHTLIIDTSNSLTELGFKSVQAVVLRPKRLESELDSPIKRRPISAGSLRLFARSSDLSLTGSVHSMLSTFSQESVVSEADSYVTIGSRFGNTGSDEVYTTACSDSDLPLQRTLTESNSRQGEDDCPTLSRKRTKLTRHQRHRPVDLNLTGASSSEGEDLLEEERLFHSSEAVVVTPKFSRLPSKIASPKDNISATLQDSVSSYCEKSKTANHDQFESTVSGLRTSPVRESQKQSHPHRTTRKPLIRHRTQGEAVPKQPYADGSTSSEESPSPEEENFDISQSIVWPALGIHSEDQQSLPKLTFKPSRQPIQDKHGKLTIIHEQSQNIMSEDQGSDIDDSISNVTLSTVISISDLEKQKSKTDSQGHATLPDSVGEIVIPKFIYVRDSYTNEKETTPSQTAANTNGIGRSTDLAVTRLVHTSQPMADEISASLTGDQPGSIGHFKVKENAPVIPPLAVSVHHATSKSASCSLGGTRTVVESQTNDKESELGDEISGGKLADRSHKADSDMPIARTSYYENPHYLNRQKYGVSHIYNDQIRYLTKENDPTDNRGGYSALTYSPEPDLRSPPLAISDANVEDQRYEKNNDGRSGPYSSNVVNPPPSTISQTSSQAGRILNSSNDTEPFGQAQFVRISDIKAPTDLSCVKTDYFTSEAEPLNRLSSRESRALSPQDVLMAPFSATSAPSYLIHDDISKGFKLSQPPIHAEMYEPVFHKTLNKPNGNRKPNVQDTDDIQAASQRTSRIITDDQVPWNSSMKLIGTSRPSNHHPYADDQVVSLMPISKDREDSDLQLSGSLYYEDLDKLPHDMETTEYEVTNSVECGSRLTRQTVRGEQNLHTQSSRPTRYMSGQSQVKLMHAPSSTAPRDKLDQNTTANSSTNRRTNSPSPTNNGFRLIGSRASPPLVRPKWHLKPIPTDNEIKERLRSRSRQRAEERQSRPAKTESNLTHRSRSSRSDSRFRCTDIDSAIAELRTDTSRTFHSLRDNEAFSETKQSASLFDLDGHTEGRRFLPSLQSHAPGPVRTAAVPLNTNQRFFGDAKSYSSLLETDIDTGENFERPVILEADVDSAFNLRDYYLSMNEEAKNHKAHSLFNLTFSNTPGTYRRQTVNAKQLEELSLGCNASPSEEWQRTKSLQGLRDRENQHHGEMLPYTHQTKHSSIGVKGLIDRLRDRAKSTHELRIAQSLTKLKVPEWIDKAECLSRSFVENGDKTEDEMASFSTKYRPLSLTKTYSTRTPTLERSGLLTSSIRSLSTIRKSGELMSSKWLQKSTTAVETVAEPTRINNSHQPRFVRPSQELRERGCSASRLRPINSKLYNSMRSLASNRYNSGSHATTGTSEIRPQVAPRGDRSMGQNIELRLSPQDFIPRYERIRGMDQLERQHPPISTNQVNLTIMNNRDATISNVYEENQIMGDSHSHFQLKEVTNDEKELSRVARCHEDIKPADQDSGTEHSTEKSEEPDAKMKIVPSSQRISKERDSSSRRLCEIQSEVIGLHRAAPTFETTEVESQERWRAQSNALPSQGDWYSIDIDGETESEATDGLDQLSDLTCLTSLVDTCASRHRALLANRPSALDHLLTSLGWWSTKVQAEHQHISPTAAEAISVAAHEFDVDEDSHRHEFLQLLSGPESRRPINLGEFALNQLSGAVQRKQEDGLLYISCGRSECTRQPIKVEQALDWCACANCYTLYCCPTCRSIDRRVFHDHPTVCSFARAKRICNRLLRNLSSGQITGLAALAKTGMARLGRGGIVLPFALVRHAELLLQRILSSPRFDEDTEATLMCWENQHQPSPGGLLSPPLYLTLNELEELDSTLSVPCRSYNPSATMVLIVVVCAYELIARADGRPVHLFKQSLIVPLPKHNHGLSTSCRSPTTELQQRVMDSTKPNLPQTNGLLCKPDRQAATAREAFIIRLQRILRERGVSLRHHYPEIYTQVANFVESGSPFSPIRIVFHDFVLREEVLCTITPMSDPTIQPTRILQSRQTESVLHEQRSKSHVSEKKVDSSRKPEIAIGKNIPTDRNYEIRETDF